jgi:nucleolar GTP-binding protein
MNFQKLTIVENADFFIDVAFGKAKEKADSLRNKVKGTRLERSGKIEFAKIETISQILIDYLNKITQSYPSIDSLPEFYIQLIKNFFEYKELKEALGGINWAVIRIKEFDRKYKKAIKGCKELNKINSYRREFYGRVSSLLKQINKQLLLLENARKTMRAFPTVKEMFTVCIAGFPNVGKSTILSKLTNAKPEINNYAFTTKGLNVGYSNQIQYIDTPGTLNRFDKMNAVEKQANLAIKYCADVIIYVFDPTCAYSLEDQKKLLLNLKKFDKDILIYLSKTDVAEKADIEKFNKFKPIIDIKELKAKVREKHRE